jgi:hypothetical protein
MKKLLLILALPLLLASCNSEPQTVKVDGKYSIELPDYMTKADSLHEEASLQYDNTLRELYIIVIDENREDYDKLAESGLYEGYNPGLGGYAALLSKQTATAVGQKTIPALADKKINGLSAKTFSLSGKVNNISAYWKVAYIQGKNRYYQIVAWTLADKEKDYSTVMDGMINSFKETDHSKKH